VKFGPITAAPLQIGPAGAPYAPAFGDIYHPASGAAGQAEHVFLAGNGLPARWRGRRLFVILETGFGLGNNFLATWSAWRRDPQRAERLVFISIEKHPFTRADMVAVHAASPWPELAAQLVRAWPALTPDLHPLSFDNSGVQLLLAFGDVQAWLPQIVADIDAFDLDGFAPARNPDMWARPVCKALARLAQPQATLATWSAARAVRDGLRAAGFVVTPAGGSGGKRDITLARFDPTFLPRRPVARRSTDADAKRHAVIVGAGLAGCATAWALARQGWTSTLLDRQSSPATEASGNPAGTFHGIVNRQDGAHARFNRAAALEAQRVISRAVAQRGVPGNAGGLIRLETSIESVDAMRAVLLRLGLPEDYVQALDPDHASALSGLPMTKPAWLYPGGGWVDPAAFARSLLEEAGARVSFHGDTPVARLQRNADAWDLIDGAGQLIETAATVVLANAGAALDLLGRPSWPLQRVRGQISLLTVEALAPTGALPMLPISGSGFLIPALRGRLTFGATSAVDASVGSVSTDGVDSTPRDEDHAANLERLAGLWDLGVGVRPNDLEGRVGWRCSSNDRLPVVGAVPVSAAVPSGRVDQPRFIAREPGLFVLIGLGSRGITWAPLAAQVLAARISGAPVPLGAALIDAIDPARFVSGRARKAKLRAGCAARSSSEIQGAA
jgi:tRNA 5-methylaminomethyl-2-thiouridine biosynthesis bifunctional protein